RGHAAKADSSAATGAIGGSQWRALVHLIGVIPQSTVSRKRSQAAIADPSVRGGAGLKHGG
ncbi:MAG: hypothetical protein ACYCX7_01805, partial [Solirubrobacteraceae bacterium]